MHGRVRVAVARSLFDPAPSPCVEPPARAAEIPHETASSSRGGGGGAPLGIRRRTSMPRAPRVLLITDPGPDPDDIKALLVLWNMHTQGIVDLVGVCCNGGGAPAARATLARCVLDVLGATVPVAIGSSGSSYAPMPHEYRIDGYAGAETRTFERGDALIARVLDESPPASLIVVCISSLRDLADAMRTDGRLVHERVSRVAIMGGLDLAPAAPYGYAPDTSVNNEFDREGASFVYDWCFAHGVPMSVVSRHAVPMLPMQLARSFSERTACPVMRYLAEAQFLGLEGLWQKLCAGQLPARCDKAWYFATFCGVDGAEFAAQRLDALGADDAIIPRLNGFVKPYDVVALLAALPTTLGLFDVPRAEVVVRAANGKSCTHLLLLGAEHMLGVDHVQKALREAYHEVVLASSLRSSLHSSSAHVTPPSAKAAKGRNCSQTTRGSSATAADDEPAGAGAAQSRRGKPRSADADAIGGAVVVLRLRGSRADGSNGVSAIEGPPPCAAVKRGADGLLEFDACAQLLLCAQLELRRNELAVYRQFVALLAVATSLLVSLSLLGAQRTSDERVAGQTERVTQLGHGCALVGYVVVVSTVGMLQPLRTHRWALRTVYALIILALSLIALHNFSRIDWHALRACADVGCARARASASDVRLGVGCAHALVALALALRCRAVERAPAAAQRRLWLACGCHFVMRIADLLVYTSRLCDPQRSCARAYAAELAMGVGALRLALLLELALLVVFTAWPGSLARTRASFVRLIARLASRRSARARLSTNAPLGLTALLLTVDLAPSAAEEAAERLRDVKASPSTIAAVHFEPKARAALARAPAHDNSPSAPPRGAAVARRHVRWLGAAFARPAPRARARVLPVAEPPAAAAAPAPIAVTDALASPSPSPSPSRKLRQLTRRWLSESGVLDRMRQRVAFDYFVVHSWGDDPVLKASALREWAAGYARAHDGRHPRLWLDALCADATRTEAEQLADLPFVMGRARGLLLLCGPKTLDRLRFAIELYVWLSTGGSVDDVQIVLVGPPSAYPKLIPKLIAAFDAYHAMYASAAADSSDPSVVEKLMRVVELARVSVFNEKVRSFLPVVREHAARAQAQALASTTPRKDALLARIDSESVLVERAAPVAPSWQQRLSRTTAPDA